MSVSLRIILFAVSLLTAFLVFRKIRRSEFVIGDTLYWLFFCSLFLILSIFPQLASIISSLLGIESPANLVFLIFIFLLLVRVFQLSVSISHIESRFDDLVRTVAIKENSNTNDK